MIYKKSLMLKVTAILFALTAGVGTIMAVRAADATICEGGLKTYYYDGDNDGFGNDSVVSESCVAPEHYVLAGGDCNDNDFSVKPGAGEVCNGLDNNCNGIIDDGLATSTFYIDFDRDQYGSASSRVVSCKAPENYIENSADCNDSNGEQNPSKTEFCDNIDNDCDGLIDEAGCVVTATSTYYMDNDNDGYGNAGISTVATSAPHKYVSNNTDCNDANLSIHPGANEVCDGVDNDCDGSIDEGVTRNYYFDGDNDGYGKAGIATTSCAAPGNYVNNDDDCNDANVNINPGKSEVCGDAVDNDCDGVVNENCIVDDDDDDDDCDCECECSCGDDCEGAQNHGGFVSCISKWTNFLKKSGEISGREKGKIVSDAAKNKFEFKYEFKGEHEDGDNNDDDKVKNKKEKNNNGKGNKSNGEGKGKK